jgi:hypothetical protein
MIDLNEVLSSPGGKIVAYPRGKNTTAGVVLRQNENQLDSKDGTHVDEGHDPSPHLLPAEMAALSMYSA